VGEMGTAKGVGRRVQGVGFGGGWMAERDEREAVECWDASCFRSRRNPILIDIRKTPHQGRHHRKLHRGHNHKC